MFINNVYTDVAVDKPIKLTNKKFRGWEVIISVLANKDIDISFYNKGDKVDDFENNDESYRLYRAMMQSDTWEKSNVVIVDNKE